MQMACSLARCDFVIREPFLDMLKRPSTRGLEVATFCVSFAGKLKKGMLHLEIQVLCLSMCSGSAYEIYYFSLESINPYLDCRVLGSVPE
jgi:hypothetical protein